MSVRIRKMVSICLNFKIYDERFAEMLNFKDSDHIDSTISMFEKVDHLNAPIGNISSVTSPASG